MRKVCLAMLVLALILSLTVSVSAQSIDSWDASGFPIGENLLIALAVGAAIGLITVLILKSQLKSVRKQDRANQYIKEGSMHLTVRTDTFLYRNVTRTIRDTGKSSSR